MSIAGDEPVEQAPLTQPEPEFSVVGIGASAGGLEALERFFSHCPMDTGAAFVVVQHLSPDHKSMMVDLLARYTDMPVVVVTDGMCAKPNMVHLIPAGTIMRIEGSTFHLEPKAPNTLTLPIDIFFTSLANSHGRLAVGVVLSGTGSDGSRGALAINTAGGFLMAQEMRSAKFDGMPGSVISTGMVDAVLPAEQLPERLVKHLQHIPAEPVIHMPTDDLSGPLSEEDAYETIVQLLLSSSGIDFHDYKLATILRRIERRLQVKHLNSLVGYARLLQSDVQEQATLKRELLIPVTQFFRDEEAFRDLREKIVEPIVQQSAGSSHIRAWIAGTSTGEEAYSIAMLFVEAFEQQRCWPNLKIFATDVSQESIDIASAGVYPESAAAELTEERLEHFFNKSGSGYQVKPELRQLIVFARHDVLADPPFTQMDLVSCRNTLIYFTADAQNKVFRRLQFAIRSGGHLFLGSSENLPNDDLGLVPLDSKHKLYRRAGQAPAAIYQADSFAVGRFEGRRIRSRPKSNWRSRGNDMLNVDGAVGTLLQHYAPPSMLVNARNEIIHLFGDVKPYFSARQGAASLDVTKVLPENIVPVASALMFKSAKEQQPMVSDLIRLEHQKGEVERLRLLVRPVKTADESSLLLLTFETVGGAPAQPQDELHAIDVDVESVKRIELLENELLATRESLQATIEELETSNEELQATNEELMAANEELQSSNEELQSVNEELNTVNAEYQEKVSILNSVNADLDSMTKAVGVATVFVDQELNLTRYSPDAVGIFKLRASDLGRPLDDIANVLNYPHLMSDLRHTMETERMIHKEVSTSDNELFMVRILPYRISSNRRGAVATFVDVTAFRDHQRLQKILNALPEHIAVLEPNGNIALVNQAWERFALANGDPSLERSAPGCNYLDACGMGEQPADPDAKRAYHGIKAVLEGSIPSFSMQYPCHSPTEKRWFVMNVAPIQGFEFGAVVSHTNITTWFSSEKETLQGNT